MNKFFLISYLDVESTKKVKEIQKQLSKLSGSRASLDLWKPHITVGEGVELSENDFNVFCEEMENVAKKFRPFKLQIRDYGFMDHWHGSILGFSPYVVYLDVIKDENLQRLAESIDITNKKYKKYYGLVPSFFPYNPHLTLAFKDLSKEGFEKAKDFLKDKKFSVSVTIDHIAIAKEQENGKCIDYRRFNFKAL